MTKGVRRAGKTLKDAERRRLAKRSRGEYPVPGTAYSLPPGWAVAWCDGGSRGNPGPAAWAYLIEDGNANVLAAAAESIGVAGAGTAEYRALVAVLEAALGLGLDRVDVRTDSRLVAAQMGPSPPPLRNPRLAELRERATDLCERIGSVTVRWVPGERNARTDGMVADLLFSRDHPRESPRA
jgi:probable phosphoglycerate mutase